MKLIDFTRRLARAGQTKEIDRLSFLTLTLLIFGGLIILRLSDLQIFRYGNFVAKAASQHNVDKILYPKRGEIYASDRHSQTLVPLATTRKFYELYAIPKEIV